MTLATRSKWIRAIIAAEPYLCTVMDTNSIDFIAQDLTRKYITLRAANRRPAPSAASGSSSSSSSSGPSTNDLAQSLQRMLQVRSPGTAAPPLQSQNLALRNPFFNSLQTVNWEVARYENRVLLDKALDDIPIARLYEEAESNLHLHPDDSLDDVLVKRLLAWFKRDFFTWVNEPPCDYCKGKTRTIGMSGPTSEERQFGAGNVELYTCTICGGQTRFPRYNDPAKLLETRRGRCGEWANCFTLCCRAIGAEARYVLDTTDHVWTEVYSEHKGRWIHCDSCEEAYDQPLLYSAGWGKKLSYCIAFSAEEAVDVTRRYTQNWAQVLARRNIISEDVLAQILRQFRQEKQTALPSERVQELHRRAEIEERELEEASRRTAVSDAEMRGRQSGSVEWRTVRNEIGTTTASVGGDQTPSSNRFEYKITKSLIANPQPASLTFVGSASALPSQLCTTNSTINPTPTLTLLRLTPSKASQAGAIYHKDKVSLRTGFCVQFAFRITNAEGGDAEGGADGFAVVVQDQGEGVVGEGGSELGYGGLQRCIAVEFDTYYSHDRADPTGHHISVHARPGGAALAAHHRYSLGSTSRLPRLNSGRWMYARVAFLPHLGRVVVDLSDLGDDRTGKGDKYERVLDVGDVGFEGEQGVLGGTESAWVGFTAGTGGLSQCHEVVGWELWEVEEM